MSFKICAADTTHAMEGLKAPNQEDGKPTPLTDQNDGVMFVWRTKYSTWSETVKY